MQVSQRCVKRSDSKLILTMYLIDAQHILNIDDSATRTRGPLPSKRLADALFACLLVFLKCLLDRQKHPDFDLLEFNDAEMLRRRYE